MSDDVAEALRKRREEINQKLAELTRELRQVEEAERQLAGPPPAWTAPPVEFPPQFKPDLPSGVSWSKDSGRSFP